MTRLLCSVDLDWFWFILFVALILRFACKSLVPHIVPVTDCWMFCGVWLGFAHIFVFSLNFWPFSVDTFIENDGRKRN
jgi:hypothetical protein